MPITANMSRMIPKSSKGGPRRSGFVNANQGKGVVPMASMPGGGNAGTLTAFYAATAGNPNASASMRSMAAEAATSGTGMSNYYTRAKLGNYYSGKGLRGLLGMGCGSGCGMSGLGDTTVDTTLGGNGFNQEANDAGGTDVTDSQGNVLVSNIFGANGGQATITDAGTKAGITGTNGDYIDVASGSSAAALSSQAWGSGSGASAQGQGQASGGQGTSSGNDGSTIAQNITAASAFAPVAGGIFSAISGKPNPFGAKPAPVAAKPASSSLPLLLVLGVGGFLAYKATQKGSSSSAPTVKQNRPSRVRLY